MYSSQSSDNTSEDGGDVTPTELRPEILIEVEKEEIVEEVEKREKSPASDHKLAGTGRTAAEDSALSSETEEVCSDTETIDVSLDGLDANSLAGSKTDKIANLNNRDYDDDDVGEEEAEDHDIKDDYDTLMFKA